MSPKKGPPEKKRKKSPDKKFSEKRSSGKSLFFALSIFWCVWGRLVGSIYKNKKKVQRLSVIFPVIPLGGGGGGKG